MASLRKSLAFSFIDRYLNEILSFVAVVALARLLTPEEVGIFSVSASFISLAQILKGFGISNYLIQEKELNQARLNTAFGITVCTSWVLGAAVAGSATLMADFFEDDRIELVIYILSVNFFLIPFGSILQAVLRRNMNFSVIMRINFCSNTIYVSSAIALAAIGFGPASMAWGSLAGTVVGIAVTYYHRPDEVYLRFGLSEWRRIAAFSTFSVSANLITDAVRSSQDFVIGKFLSLEAVGLFSRANGLMQIFSRSVTMAIVPVAQSAFAERIRKGHSIEGDFLHGCSALTAIGWPAFMFLGVMAEEIILVLFGENWIGAVAPAQILALTWVISVPALLYGSVFLALGAARSLFFLELITRPPMIVLMVLAAWWFGTIEAVAWAIVVSGCWAVFYTLHKVLRLVGASWHKLGRVLLPSVVAATAAAVPLIGVSEALPVDWHPLIHLMIVAVSVAPCWIVALMATKHPLFDEIKGLAGRVTARI